MNKILKSSKLGANGTSINYVQNRNRSEAINGTYPVGS